MLARRNTPLIAAWVATLLGACGGAGGDTEMAPPPHASCTVAQAEGVPSEALLAVHTKAKEVGALLGEREASRFIEARTADGYRLRGLVSTLAMGLSLFLVGGLLGALLLNLLRKPPTLRYAERLAEAIRAELAALDPLLTGDDGISAVLTPLAEPLADVERRSERLADLCAPLERERDDTQSAARQGELYRQLERLLGHLERLHLQAVAWRDRLGTTTPGPIGDEVERAADALRADLEALE